MILDPKSELSEGRMEIDGTTPADQGGDQVEEECPQVLEAASRG